MLFRVSSNASRLRGKEISKMREIREEILGPKELITPEKACIDEHGDITGGIAIERSLRSNLFNRLKRVYQLSLVQQAAHTTAPAAASKVGGLVSEPDLALRSKLLAQASKAIVEGMASGPSGLLEQLETQAELANFPRIGTDTNVAHAAFQLNVTTAKEKKDVSADNMSIASLGKFGGSHVDGNDTPASPTAMTVLSQEYDGVEEDVFYILDFGIGWVLEPVTIIYFSGLHYHGGCQPVYKPDRVDKNFVYYRLTLIAYPPDDILSGNDAVTFANLPNGKPLKIGWDYRDA
jgi:hypothetical protein